MKTAIPLNTPLPEAFWAFASHRMTRFWHKLDPRSPVAEDDILEKTSFTNCYRVLDRTTQYLIQEVQAIGPQTPEDIYFRTLLFKIFNLPLTWEYLRSKGLGLAAEDFDYRQVTAWVSEKPDKVFSSSYLISPGYPPPGYPEWPTSKGRKAAAYMQTLDFMLRERYPERLQALAPNWTEAMKLMNKTMNMGGFLSYQYLTDLGYTEAYDYPEDTYTFAGPQAREGIYQTYGRKNFVTQIARNYEVQNAEFKQWGLDFRGIPGRPLQMIDIQNLFCEFTKYAKLTGMMTENFLYGSGRGEGSSKNKRFRYYRPNLTPMPIVLPAKWGLEPIEGVPICSHS